MGLITNHFVEAIAGKNNAVVDVTIATVMIHRLVGGMKVERNKNIRSLNPLPILARAPKLEASFEKVSKPPTHPTVFQFFLRCTVIT